VIFITREHGDCALTDDEAGQLLTHLRPVIAKNDDTYELMNAIEDALGTNDSVLLNGETVSHGQPLSTTGLATAVRRISRRGCGASTEL